MYSIHAELKGDAPFLFNRMVDSSVLDTGASGGVSTKQARLAEAEARVYRHKSGALCVPRWTLKRVLLDGARESKAKLAKTSLYKLVNAFVFLPDDPLFDAKERSFIHETVGRIPPGPRGKAAIIRRPALDSGWRLRFDLAVANDAIQPETLKDALALAGALIGIGSWRPEYGRFVVSTWDIGRVGKKGRRS